MGKNASGQTHYLSLSGFELYGTVNGVCEDQLGKDMIAGFSNLLKQLHLSRVILLLFLIFTVQEKQLRKRKLILEDRDV